MKRRTIAVLGTVVATLGVAPPAHADAVPFDVHYQAGPQALEAGVTRTEDTGLVGVCDREPFCTGIALRATASNVTAETESGTLTVRGYVCVFDVSPSCSVNGVAFTGLRFTEVVVDAPGGAIAPFPAEVEVCVWYVSPPESPDLCSPASFFTGEVRWSGEIGPPIGPPEDLGLSS